MLYLMKKTVITWDALQRSEHHALQSICTYANRSLALCIHYSDYTSLPSAVQRAVHDSYNRGMPYDYQSIMHYSQYVSMLTAP